MSLWIPKDTGRPLWAQRRFPSGNVGDRFLLSPIALDHCKDREARGRQASSVEGGPQRGRRLPGGGVPLDDGSCGGGGLGSATRGDGHKYRPALRPRSLPTGRIDSPAPAEVGCGAGTWSRGLGQRQTLPRGPPLAPQPGFPWRPLHYNGRERAYDGPTPSFQILDFAHVALTETTQGGWSSNPASLIDVVPGGGAEQQRDFFPYLQLHPPHCDSCTC